MAPPPAATPYTSLLQSPTPTAGELFDAAFFPATPNPFNVVALMAYVVCTSALTYYAYAGVREDAWVMCLLNHSELLFMVMLCNLIGDSILEGLRRRRHRAAAADVILDV